MAQVTDAVILAAGRGSRLGALTERFPKALLEVGGEPILHRILRGLAAAGIERAFVVTGHEASRLERATGDGGRWGVEIRYFRQQSLDGTARGLALARDVARSPFFVGWGDILIEQANYRRIIDAASAGDSVIALNEVDDPFAGAAVYVNEEFLVTGIVEKPPLGTSTTRWNNAGLMVLNAAIWPFIDLLEPSARGEYELPRAIAAFVQAGGRVRGLPLQGPWFDAGTPESLEAARRYFAR